MPSEWGGLKIECHNKCSLSNSKHFYLVNLYSKHFYNMKSINSRNVAIFIGVKASCQQKSKLKV